MRTRDCMPSVGLLYVAQHLSAHTPMPVQTRQQGGAASREFTGVPLFHAEGLTVQTKDGPLTPLFFSRRDLDKAVRVLQTPSIGLGCCVRRCAHHVFACGHALAHTHVMLR